MFGSFWINIIFGIIGFLLVFTLSLSSNIFTTSLIRASITFCLFFLFGYLMRFALHIVTQPNTAKNSTLMTHDDHEEKQIENDESAETENEIPEDLIERTSEFVRELLHEEDQQQPHGKE